MTVGTAEIEAFLEENAAAWDYDQGMYVVTWPNKYRGRYDFIGLVAIMQAAEAEAADNEVADDA